MITDAGPVPKGDIGSVWSSPLMQARIAGFFWMLCVLAGMYGLLVARGTPLGRDAVAIAGAAYLVVTVLLYTLLKPVNPTVSLIAFSFGIVGIAAATNTYLYFGFQCILVGYLVAASTFLPRVIGALMVLAGLAQLVFFTALLPSSLTTNLAPVGYIADGIGEIALALWLLILGVNAVQWDAMASLGRGPK